MVKGRGYGSCSQEEEEEVRVGGAKGGYLCDSPRGAEEQQEQRAWSRPGPLQEARPPARRAPRRSHQLLHKEARYRHGKSAEDFLPTTTTLSMPTAPRLTWNRHLNDVPVRRLGFNPLGRNTVS